MKVTSIKFDQVPSRFPTLTGFVVIVLLALGISYSQFGNTLNLRLLDVQFQLMQESGVPGDYTVAPVLIGLDEATSTALPEPTTLWHRHLAQLFAAVADAKPSVVGLQLPLPMRSYAFIAPEYDKALASGLGKLTATVPVVIGQSVGSTGRVRKVYPELLSAVGNPTLAITSTCSDPDGVVRRFDYAQCAELTPLLKQPDAKPLALVMAEKLGKPAQNSGLIDYGRGGVIRYIPMADVLKDIEHGQTDKLKQAIAGRPVLIGTLLPTETRFTLPVALAGWEPGNNKLPTTLVQFQALRTLLGNGMVTPLPGRAFLIVACCLFWFRRNNIWKFLVLTGFVGLTIGTSYFMLKQQASFLPAGMLVFACLFAYASRIVFDYFLHHQEKNLLRSAFAGYVSPRVLREILRTGSRSQQLVGAHEATLLFADIRGFSERCATLSSERTFELLNRYFSEAVAAVQQRGGAVDRFVGDALIASFGVPLASQQAERNAMEAAQDILLRLEHLNRELVAENQPPLAVGIGIHSGSVASGYIGSRGRNDYTLIGNAIGIAARLESFGRHTDFPVICSHAVAQKLQGMGQLTSLGEADIRGLPRQEIWGWRPSVLNKS